MAKSKRAKIVSLTKTGKKGKVAKEGLVERIQALLGSCSSVFVFSVENPRTELLQKARAELRGRARFFNGKKSVMAKALGSGPEDELLPGLSALASRLEGEVGLLVVRESTPDTFAGTLEEGEGFISEADLRDYLESLEQPEFARAGTLASETVSLPSGPLHTADGTPVPANVEGQLRQAGLPVSLIRGIVSLAEGRTVCTEGEKLTADQARILKILDYPLVSFRIRLLAKYCAGEVVDFEEKEEEEDAEK
jgi:mRNA turnover protein 4